MTNDERKDYQFALLESKQNMTIHSLDDIAIPLHLIMTIRKDSPIVKVCIDSGLTAVIYHVYYAGKDYCLKVKRQEAKVKNDDGKLSFLNEILCRKRLEEHRDNPIIAKGITKTYYADLKRGFILSEWVDGDLDQSFTYERMMSIFTLGFELEKLGLFEWDMCKGNILFRGNEVTLFDFGYMYPTDILKGPNPDGLKNVIFHSVERLETRSLMQVLIDLEKKHALDEAHSLYRQCKMAAIASYSVRLSYLIDQGANDALINYYQTLIGHWKLALKESFTFMRLYRSECARSFSLDILDDLSGKSCTIHTLSKIDKMLDLLALDYEGLKASGGFLHDAADADKETLIKRYEERRLKALAYQL